MQGDHLRKGRLGEGRPHEVTKFLSSMESDRWIADADLLVDIAHLIMLRKQGIIEPEPAIALMKVLLELNEHGLPETVYDPEYEDIHAGIEAYLIGRLGRDYGGRLHMGRSRNDEVATCLRIRARGELLAHMERIVHLRTILLDLSARHAETAMPGFTHLQHAQPTTLAHHFLSYEQAFGRDFDRFRGAYARVNRCPLGAAAFASTGYPIDRSYTASLLGFEEIAENTMDAVSARDFALEIIASCAICIATVSRLCEELVIWSSSFVDFVRLSDAYCSTSSIMPQKKNPDTAEIMRAKTGVVNGALVHALTCMKALPMSYNRDMQDLTPALWESLQTTGQCLDLLGKMLVGAEFNIKRMREEAEKGHSTATDLADMLVREFGMPFRTAHGIVGRAVRKGVIDSDTLEEASREVGGPSLKECGVTEEQIKAALDVDCSIAARDVPGGPAPAATRAHIRKRMEDCERDNLWSHGALVTIKHAYEEMLTQAWELIEY